MDFLAISIACLFLLSIAIIYRLESELTRVHYERMKDLIRIINVESSINNKEKK